MSNADKIRKLNRKIKLLEHLQTMNTDSLIIHAGKLGALQSQAAELDRIEQEATSFDFMDLRVKYRASLIPEIREVSKEVQFEIGRSAGLKSRIESIQKMSRTIKSRILEIEDTENLHAILADSGRIGSPALRKQKPR